MYKQIIIVRKDLHMSHGKMAAQVSHASMAFLTNMIRQSAKKAWNSTEIRAFFEDIFKPDIFINPVKPSTNDTKYPTIVYQATLEFNKELFEEWIQGSFTKCILEAKNKNALMKSIEMADKLGMTLGKDYFPIYDNCYTELHPEEENGTTLTCVGFIPMNSDRIDQIGKKYQLYKED